MIGGNVGAKAVRALTRPIGGEGVVVVMRVGIQDEVVAAILDEKARAHVVMDVEPLEDVVAAVDPDSPGLVVQVVVLPDMRDFDPFQMNPIGRHVETLDPAVVPDAFEIENRGFAGISPVADRLLRGATLLEIDPAHSVVGVLARSGALVIGIGAATKIHGVTGLRPGLRVRHRSPWRIARSRRSIASIWRDIVGFSKSGDRGSTQRKHCEDSFVFHVDRSMRSTH